MAAEFTQIEQFLIDSGLVTHADLQQARIDAGEGGNIGGALLAKGLLTEDDLRRVDAYLLGIPFVDLKGKDLDLETLSLVPEPIARNYNLIAFKRSGRTLEVAALDVNDLEEIEFLKEKNGFKLLPRLTDRESLRRALVQYGQALKSEFGDIIKKDISELPRLSKDASREELMSHAEDLSLGRLVDTILKHAVAGNASDIHIEPGEKDTLVRYRIKGKLHDAMMLPKDAAFSIALRLKRLCGLSLDEDELQEGRFVLELDNERLAVRLSVLPTRFGEKIVMRLLKEGALGFSLEGLGLYGDVLDKVHRALEETEGLVLVAGPRGSGKTTMLYTMLDIINRPELDVSTVEDPIEFELPRVTQVEAHPERGFSYANALRALLRQDPDVIMIGELKDIETANLAATAASSGKLVISSVDASSATDAVGKLLDLGVEPATLSNSLNMIVGQRLARRLSSDREKYFLTADEQSSLGSIISLEKILDIAKREKLVSPADTWGEIGFSRMSMSNLGDYGLIGVQELLPVTPSLKKLIACGAYGKDLREKAKAEGMVTLAEDAILKAIESFVSLEEALKLWKETEN